MAISSDKLLRIIQISRNFGSRNISEEALLTELAKERLLPQKLMPKDSVEAPKGLHFPFASKQAKELAAELKLKVKPGEGSGKNGNFTQADVKELAQVKTQKPAKKSADITASAEKFAREAGIEWKHLIGKGAGKDNTILKSDIMALALRTEPDSDDSTSEYESESEEDSE